MKTLAVLAVLAALSVAGMAVQAKDTATTKAAVEALAGVPTAELPAVAAKQVMAAPKDARNATVSAVVRRVARTHPAALPQVVASIAKADPSLAAVAAGVAAKANPKGVGVIAAAACTAAPEKAAEIVAVCSKVTTMGHATLAEAVSNANPAFASQSLADQAAAVDITSSASVITGGTVIVPIGPPPAGSIGYTIQGDPVVNAPSAETGAPGFDPDRYASGGS